MNDITLVIAIAGVLAVLGAVLLWRGWRGKRHGDHPYCRRCGFNLFGSSSDAKVCPECGADLAVPRAIVIGVRQRRMGMALSGAAMLLPAMLILVTVIGGTVAGVDWGKHAPPWWLIHQAQSGDKLIRDTALAELLSRFTAGTLSNAQLASAVEAGLDYQGHADKPWSVGWGDLLEAAQRKSMLSADQWDRYVKQAVTTGSIKLTVRQRVHPGDPVAYVLEGVTASGDRVGRGGPGVRLYKILRINGLAIDGNEMMSDPGIGALAMTLAPGSSAMGMGTGGIGTGGIVLTGTTPARVTWSGSGGGFGAVGGGSINSSTIVAPGGGMGGGSAGVNSGMIYLPNGNVVSAMRGGVTRGLLDLDQEKMAQLKPGVHQSEIRVGMKVTPNMPLRNGSVRYTFSASAATNPAEMQKVMRDRQMQADRDIFRNVMPVLAESELKIPVKIEVLAPDEPTVLKIDDEKYRRGVEEALRVNRVRALGARLDVQVSCTDPPIDLSYAVIVRQGEKEWPVGTIAFAKGTSGTALGLNSPGGFILPQDMPAGPKVDVVLRPDPAAAMANLDISSYWGGDVTIKDVPMEGTPRAMTVATAYPTALQNLEALTSSMSGASGLPGALNVDPFGGSSRRSSGFGSGSGGLSLGGLNDSTGGAGGKSSAGPTTAPTAPSPAAGYVLRIELRPKNGNGGGAGGTTVTREMLIYPRVPFMQRFTESANDGGGNSATTFSGQLIPGADATHFRLDMTYAIEKAGHMSSRERIGTQNVTLGESTPFGSTSEGIAKTVTVTPMPN